MVAQRQLDLTVILENVHDPFNIGAVLRSCDSVGIREIFVVYTDPDLLTNRLSIGRRTAMGTQKWVDVHLYTELDYCMDQVKSRYEKIYSTHLADDSKSIYDFDLTQSVALMFGNESDGLSREILAYSDGNFLIPQWGMAKSLNISVACAISLYEAQRQRHLLGFYDNNPANPNHQDLLLDNYLERHFENFSGKEISPKERD